MNFDDTATGLRFSSYREADEFCREQCDLRDLASFGVFVVAGRISYSPPKKQSIRRMCKACRRREIKPKHQFCDNAKCKRARSSLKQQNVASGAIAAEALN